MRYVLLFVSLVCLTPWHAFCQNFEVAVPPEHHIIALKHAPVHYQSYHEKCFAGDLLTRIDYDGDWNTGNNWENLCSNNADLSGAVYYSVIESERYYFISYLFFHPRDYKRPFEIEFQHENDLEGAVMMIEKRMFEPDSLIAVVTRAHSNQHLYMPESSTIQPGKWPEGAFHFFDGRVITYQEPGGHGCYAYQPGGTNRKEDKVLKYYPTLFCADEDYLTEPHKKRYYKLYNIFEKGGLWSRKMDTLTFRRYGDFHNTKTLIGGANAPWNWQDRADPEAVKKGDIAVDPANLFSHYLDLAEIGREQYVYNPYKGIW